MKIFKNILGSFGELAESALEYGTDHASIILTIITPVFTLIAFLQAAHK